MASPVPGTPNPRNPPQCTVPRPAFHPVKRGPACADAFRWSCRAGMNTRRLQAPHASHRLDGRPLQWSPGASSGVPHACCPLPPRARPSDRGRQGAVPPHVPRRAGRGRRRQRTGPTRPPHQVHRLPPAGHPAPRHGQPRVRPHPAAPPGTAPASPRRPVYVNKIHGHRTTRSPSRIGARLPAYRTGVGRIRREGIAYDRQEGSLGLTCVAVPVMGPAGRPVAALSVAVAGHRFDPARHAPALRRVAHAASRTLTA
ncbi:MAG TPA: IclR family transcriptional regulator C-terminal domain-containing protein [Streptomyces sp.]